LTLNRRAVRLCCPASEVLDMVGRHETIILSWQPSRSLSWRSPPRGCTISHADVGFNRQLSYKAGSEIVAVLM
jgi:hypothetical protein